MTQSGEKYISLDDAAAQLSVTKGTIYYYTKALKLETKKFQFDRRAYLTMEDFERIKAIKDEAAHRGQPLDEDINTPEAA